MTWWKLLGGFKVGARTKTYSRPNRLARMFSEIFPTEIEPARSFEDVMKLCEENAEEASKHRAVDLGVGLFHLFNEVGRFSASNSELELRELLLKFELGSSADIEGYLDFAHAQARASQFLNPLVLAYLGVVFAYPKEMDKFALEFLSESHAKGSEIIGGLDAYNEFSPASPQTLEAIEQIKTDLEQQDREQEFTREHLRPKQGGRPASARKDSCLIAIIQTSWQARGNWRAGIPYFEKIVQKLEPNVAERELEEKEIDRKLRRIANWFHLPCITPKKT